MRRQLAVSILAANSDAAIEIDTLGLSAIAQERVKGASVILEFFYDDHTYPQVFLVPLVLLSGEFT
jgi:hypothetical protein